jgi:hypothetical protein
MKKQSRLSEIDALKGLAIVGVVVAHISFEGRLSLDSLEAVSWLKYLLGWCVIAFFFASGLLYRGTPVSRQGLFAYAKKKFIRLIVPCITFSITYRLILVGIYMTGYFSWESPLPSTIAEGIDFIFSPIGPQFYFLYYLFIVTTVVATIEYLLSKEILLIASMIFLPLLYMFILVPESGFGPEYELLPIYCYSYLAGGALSIQNRSEKIRRMFMVLVPVLATIYLSNNYIACYILIVFLLYTLFYSLPLLTTYLNKTGLGYYSSGIYVWHAPIVLPFVSIVCVKVIGGGPAVILPMIVFTILICVVFSRITLKYDVFRLWRF